MMSKKAVVDPLMFDVEIDRLSKLTNQCALIGILRDSRSKKRFLWAADLCLAISMARKLHFLSKQASGGSGNGETQVVYLSRRSVHYLRNLAARLAKSGWDREVKIVRAILNLCTTELNCPKYDERFRDLSELHLSYRVFLENQEKYRRKTLSSSEVAA